MLSQLKFDEFKPRKMPNFELYQAEVKLNIAMLKREKHLLDKQETSEVEIVR